jgi:hypothetical protein
VNGVDVNATFAYRLADGAQEHRVQYRKKYCEVDELDPKRPVDLEEHATASATFR